MTDYWRDTQAAEAAGFAAAQQQARLNDEDTMPILAKVDRLLCGACGTELPRDLNEVFRIGWVVCADCMANDEELRQVIDRRGSVSEIQWHTDLAVLFLGRQRERAQRQEAP